MDEDVRDETARRWWGRVAGAWVFSLAALHFYRSLGGGVGLSVSAGPWPRHAPRGSWW